MCPTKITKKSQDMSDRKTYVPEKNGKKNAIYVCHNTISTAKRLEWLLNVLRPLFQCLHPFYSTHNTIHLEVMPHLSLTTCYLIKAPCMDGLDVGPMRMGKICVFQENTKYFLSDKFCVFLVIFVGHI